MSGLDRAGEPITDGRADKRDRAASADRAALMAAGWFALPMMFGGLLIALLLALLGGFGLFEAMELGSHPRSGHSD